MSTPEHPHWILRRADQATVAAIVLLCLAATGGWIAVQSGLRQRMLEVDGVESKCAQFQVDVNKAEVPELIQLPGVGNTLAERIVESREKDGPFADLDELRRVKGIGAKTFERIRPYLLPMPGKSTVAEK